MKALSTTSICILLCSCLFMAAMAQDVRLPATAGELTSAMSLEEVSQWLALGDF